VQTKDWFLTRNEQKKTAKLTNLKSHSDKQHVIQSPYFILQFIIKAVMVTINSSVQLC